MMAMACITLLMSWLFVVAYAFDLKTLLVKNSSMFDKCETSICFLFRSENPIVNLDAHMRQNLFQCRQRSRIYPGLHGPFLDLVDEIPELQDSYCIWAGPNTTFDGMVDFVRYVSRGERPLKFVVGGMLFQMSYRISNGSIPSASINSGKIVVVSENRLPSRAFSDAMKSIFGPFGHGTWWLLSGIIALFGAVYFLINYCFVTNTRWETICNAMLEPFVPRHWLLGNINDVVREGNERETRSSLIRWWKIGAMLFFLISALFYEIGIVAFVTDNRPHVLPFMLRGMGEEKLRKFVVNPGSAFESILRDLALPETISRNPKPWQTVGTFDGIYDTLCNRKKRTARYCLSSDQTALYELHNRGLCTKLAVQDPSDPIPDYTTVWYYSSHVGLTLRTVLDQRISRLREQGRIQKLIELNVGKVTLACGFSRNSISIFVLLFPLSMLLGPFFFSILVVLLVRRILHRRQNRKPTTDLVEAQLFS